MSAKSAVALITRNCLFPANDSRDLRVTETLHNGGPIVDVSATRKCAVCGAPLRTPKTGRPPSTWTERRRAHAATRARRRRRSSAGLWYLTQDPTPMPTGGRDPLTRRLVRAWLREYAPTAEHALSAKSWQAMEELLQQHSGDERLAWQLRDEATDPLLRISAYRWRALRGELKEAFACALASPPGCCQG